MDEPNEETLAAARRYLSDLMIFEGAKFIVPEELTTAEIVVPRGAETLAAAVEAAAEIAGPIAAVTASADALAEDAAVAEAEQLIAAADSPVAVAAGKVAEQGDVLEVFRRQICDCTRCALGATRQNFVFGAGDPAAGIMFVGEAPGAEEDRQGEPFVGASGQLLSKIIAAMNLRREDVFICNILKCRPPNNRDPQPEEIEQCEPYLKRQIEIIQPKVICTLGRFAAQTLLRSSESMGRLRGQLHHYEGIPLVATYHPAALLRNPQWKRPTWEDIKRVRQIYDGVEL